MIPRFQGIAAVVGRLIVRQRQCGVRCSGMAMSSSATEIGVGGSPGHHRAERKLQPIATGVTFCIAPYWSDHHGRGLWVERVSVAEALVAAPPGVDTATA